MKKQSKVAILIVCVIAILASTLLGTLAYLVDVENTTNTFVVGKVDIDLDEGAVDAETGEFTDEGATRVEKYQDVKLVPGRVIDKDPTVYVIADSEESYIRAFVTFTDLADLKAIYTDAADIEAALAVDETKWVLKATTENADDTVTYEYRYYQKVETVGKATQKLEPIFTAFTVLGDATNEQLLALEGIVGETGLAQVPSAENVKTTMEIQIIAQAIQAETFADDDAAWDAFTEQNTGNGVMPTQPAAEPAG